MHGEQRLQAIVAQTVASHGQMCQVHKTLESRLHDVNQPIVAEVKHCDLRDVGEELFADDSCQVVPGETEMDDTGRESRDEGQ